MKICSGAWVNGTAMTLDLVYSACAISCAIPSRCVLDWSLPIERLIPPHPEARNRRQPCMGRRFLFTDSRLLGLDVLGYRLRALHGRYVQALPAAHPTRNRHACVPAHHRVPWR